MSVILRKAAADDAAEVAEVYLASRKEFLPYAPLAHPDEGVREWVATRLIPTGQVVVAVEDGQVAGMLVSSTARGVSWIDQLYLRPGAVGRGTGSLLLGEALHRLSRPVHLFTFQQNTAALRFYERHGFREISRSDGSENEEKCPDVLLALVGC